MQHSIARVVVGEHVVPPRVFLHNGTSRLILLALPYLHILDAQETLHVIDVYPAEPVARLGAGAVPGKLVGIPADGLLELRIFRVEGVGGRPGITVGQNPEFEHARSPQPAFEVRGILQLSLVGRPRVVGADRLGQEFPILVLLAARVERRVGLSEPVQFFFPPLSRRQYEYVLEAIDRQVGLQHGGDRFFIGLLSRLDHQRVARILRGDQLVECVGQGLERRPASLHAEL